MSNNILDVAEHILKKYGPMTTMKLQKLCFYTQAYSLAWFDSPAFNERVEAWTNGPVVYELFDKHRGRYSIDHIPGGDDTKVTAGTKLIADTICELFGGMSGAQLSDRTHSEQPWIDAFAGDTNGDRWPNQEITHEAMREFYSRTGEHYM